MAPNMTYGKKEITLETLQSLFHLPEKAVAAELGICLTSLKKVARSLGITRWPYRKLLRLKTLETSMRKMSSNADTSSLTGIALAYAMKGNSAIALPVCEVPALHHAEQQQQQLPAGRDTQEEEGDDEVLSCSIVNENELMVTNWSNLWTVHSLRRHLLFPLGGTDVSFSSNGYHATLVFPSADAAAKACDIVLKACEMVCSRPTSPSSTESSTESTVASPMDVEKDQTSKDIMSEQQPVKTEGGIYEEVIMQPGSAPNSQTHNDMGSMLQPGSSPLMHMIASCSRSSTSPPTSLGMGISDIAPNSQPWQTQIGTDWSWCLLTC